jgi:hypothetical protein
MSKIAFLKNRWFITLVSAFLIGCLPMSNHMSVPTQHFEKDLVSDLSASHNDVITKSAENQHTSSELCCSACCPSCVFMIAQFVFTVPCGGNVKVVNSTQAFQVVYIKSIIPPPKA